MFQYKDENLQFRSCMNKHIVFLFVFLSSLLFHVQTTYFRVGRNASLFCKLFNTDIFIEPHIPPCYEAMNVF